VLSVLSPKVTAVGVEYEIKGCKMVELMSARLLSPANDEMWLASVP
jgi:hypothetical protein